jgi:hypothetical protein
MKKYLIILMLVFPIFTHAETAALILDTGFETINTIEATLKIPAGVSIDSITTGDSMVLIWIQAPLLDKEAGIISFTGLIPGGFAGKRAVFAFSGNFKDADLREFAISNVTALKNDGKGTILNVNLALDASAPSSDILPPISFQPVIGHSLDIFGGRKFVSFLTQDKETGIDHYEYALKSFGQPGSEDWRIGTSPIPLSRTEYFKSIYIKAVDRAGNEQITVIPGPYRYAGIFMLVVLCIILIVCAPFSKRFLFS